MGIRVQFLRELWERQEFTWKGLNPHRVSQQRRLADLWPTRAWCRCFPSEHREAKAHNHGNVVESGNVTQGSRDSSTATKSMRRGRAPGIADHHVAPHDEVSDCKKVFAAVRPACKSASCSPLPLSV